MCPKLMVSVYLCLVVAVLDTSCGSSNTNKEPSLIKSPADSAGKEKVAIPEKDTMNMQAPDLPYTRLTANLNLKIDSLRKQVDSTSTFFKQYAKQVAAWKLTAPEIKTILLASEEIDGHEFHYKYNVLPCFYTGQIILDRKRAFFELNAGAHCTIFFKDSTIHLGYKRADAENHFLSGPEEQ